MQPEKKKATDLVRLPLRRLSCKALPNQDTKTTTRQHSHQNPKYANLVSQEPLLGCIDGKDKKNVGEQYAWNEFTRNAGQVSTDRRVTTILWAAYDVDSRIFEGIKLILFRVRASGTGMLLTDERNGGSTLQRLSPNRAITLILELYIMFYTAP
jgi:hypothetical protein